MPHHHKVCTTHKSDTVMLNHVRRDTSQNLREYYADEARDANGEKGPLRP